MGHKGNYMNLGKAFKKIREERGLSRAQVAGAIGVTSSALWKIEAGKTSPKEMTIRKFCAHTHVPIAYFYNWAMTIEDFYFPPNCLTVPDNKPAYIDKDGFVHPSMP